MVIENDINSIDCFGWQDVYFAIKSAKLVRVKNKIPVQTIEGATGLLITIRFTSYSVMHVTWKRPSKLDRFKQIIKFNKSK